jgi:glyoxylase-like metal-dependent hydrolase (beta-lactamase superfamily II)
MQSISRRGFVISATAAAAAFGLDGPLEFLTPAHAQKADKGFVKFKVGDIEVIQMYDGVWEKAHDPAFVKNASLDDVKAALKAGGVTDAHVPITFTVTAIRNKGKLVLFDSGTGAQLAPTAGNITKNNLWAAAGINPAEVTNIVITHFHGDHISGLMAKDTNAPVFPKAQIHVPANEYKFWTNPSTTAGAAKRIQAVFPGWANIRQFEGEIEVVPGVRAVSTPGHTPGCTTWTTTTPDGGRNYEVVIIGCIAPNERTVLVQNRDYPQIVDDFNRSYKFLRTLHPDVYLGSHTEHYNMQEKYARLGKGPNPFVDPQGYFASIDKYERQFKQALENQQKAAGGNP